MILKNLFSSKTKNAEETKENKLNKIKNEFEHSDFGEIEVKDIPRSQEIVINLSSKFMDNYTSRHKP